MAANETKGHYASTERDTDLDSVEFRTWDEMLGKLPPDGVPIWALGDPRRLQADKSPGGEAPLFAFARILGTDYVLSAYQAYADYTCKEIRWYGYIQTRGHGKAVTNAETCEEVIENLRAYARDTLTNEEGVIECLRETDREFVRQARDAGATVTFMNDGSERNKLIEIRIGNDLSTDEHPFRQGFRLSTYARPEGCHWGCWYYFDGVDFPYSRQRGITVDARKGFSVARIVEDAGRCDGCGRSFHIDELRTVGFANASCPECREKLKRKFEPKGWCD